MPVSGDSNFNILCTSAENSINLEMESYGVRRIGQLRTCKASVYETKNWFILRSYRTIVAAIHKDTHIGYDFLRYVYGYTATSAQHIYKFFADYDADKIYTYRP